MAYFWLALLIVVVIVVRLLIWYFGGRAVDSVERSVRTGAVANENELLHTVVIFKTTMSLSAVRQYMTDNVVVKGDLWNGRATVLADSDNGIAWEIGSVAVGGGFKAQVAYSVSDNYTEGRFSIVSHAMKSGVSPYIKRMTELREQIIAAFKSMDPNVEISTSQQQTTNSRR